MLLVETYVSLSEGKGIGLFAKRAIKKGAFYWIRNEAFDKVISEVELNTLDPLATAYVKNYGFLEVTGNWYLCSDNARFSNHSETSNTIISFTETGLVKAHVASVDIDPEQEIFCDYRDICLTCKNGVVFAEQLEDNK